MKRKRILLTCASGQFGGTQIRMIEEARFLQEHGYDIIVAVPRFAKPDTFRSMLDEFGIPHSIFEPPPLMNDWRRRHWHWLRAETSGRSRFTSFRPDLVHVFFAWNNQGRDQLWQAGRARIPAVISVHNSFSPTHPSPWHQRHLKTAFHSVRGIYGVSDNALNQFLTNFTGYLPITATRSTVYNFVDMNRFQPSLEQRSETRETLGIPKEVPLIGSVGRLDHQKQPISVVNTFALIRKYIPDAHMLWTGDGPLRNKMRDRIHELGLRDSVHLLEHRNDIENIYPAMDIHLLLSTREGFGIVTAEAMACGLPVVGTRVPGTDEVIGDCPAGRLVSPGDEQAAADATIELLSQNARERGVLGDRARQWVAGHFSKEIWKDNLCRFYERAFPEG